jgi:hypothetical protein
MTRVRCWFERLPYRAQGTVIALVLINGGYLLLRIGQRIMEAVH